MTAITLASEPEDDKRFDHLGEKARSLVDKSDNERLRFIAQDHWIGHTAAKNILEKMEDLLKAPRVVRPEGLLIVGETNNGKSRTIKRFLDTHLSQNTEDSEGARLPIIAIQAPPVADEKRLYDAIMLKLGGEVCSATSAGMQNISLVTTLKNVGAKILIIDEFHHSVGGGTQRHRDCLNAIKFLSNEVSMSVVVVGIKSLHHAMANFDPQMENRCKPMVLPRWEYGPGLVRLLKSMEQLLPLKNPSNLEEETIARRIGDLCDGKIGEIWTILALAARKAIESGKERIDMDLVREVEKIAPTYRRAMLNGIC